jgi:hypothetical protein
MIVSKITLLILFKINRKLLNFIKRNFIIMVFGFLKIFILEYFIKYIILKNFSYFGSFIAIMYRF